MKAIKFCAICALGVMMMISCSTKTSDEGQPAGITKAQVDSVSYALGQNFGMVISMNDFGSLNLNEIVSGMKDILLWARSILRRLTASVVSSLK